MNSTFFLTIRKVREMSFTANSYQQSKQLVSKSTFSGRKGPNKKKKKKRNAIILFVYLVKEARRYTGKCAAVMIHIDQGNRTMLMRQ